uniref:cGMP-dependent protein kinase interacting domain-containing protein n=1 Tax=Panagrellus redivivus TaxID=6233 RepID=A0A7E4UQK0_PANRE
MKSQSRGSRRRFSTKSNSFPNTPTRSAKRAMRRRFRKSRIINEVCGSFSNATASFGPLRVQCPDAPRNTTAFLIEDLEQREFRDSSPPSTSVSPTTRVRSSSSTSVDWCTEKLIPTCISDDQDAQIVDDFEFMTDAVHRERLDTLSRDEVGHFIPSKCSFFNQPTLQINRELKTIEEQNRDLVNHFTKLRQENDTLRQLLKANGIDPPQAIASNC